MKGEARIALKLNSDDLNFPPPLRPRSQFIAYRATGPHLAFCWLRGWDVKCTDFGFRAKLGCGLAFNPSYVALREHGWMPDVHFVSTKVHVAGHRGV